MPFSISFLLARCPIFSLNNSYHCISPCSSVLLFLCPHPYSPFLPPSTIPAQPANPLLLFLTFYPVLLSPTLPTSTTSPCLSFTGDIFALNNTERVNIAERKQGRKRGGEGILSSPPHSSVVRLLSMPPVSFARHSKH